MSQNSPQQRATPGSTWIVLLFALTTLQSAYLIFLVQPMVGKHILPWFGGAPAVWTLCLAFYQTTLFLGYAYAHVLERWVRPALQPLVHACVLLAAFQALPVLPDATWKPAGADSICTICSKQTLLCAMEKLAAGCSGSAFGMIRTTGMNLSRLLRLHYPAWM